MRISTMLILLTLVVGITLIILIATGYIKQDEINVKYPSDVCKEIGYDYYEMIGGEEYCRRGNQIKKVKLDCGWFANPCVLLNEENGE